MSQCNINIRHFSQLDNDQDWNSGPWNECSFSSMAGLLYHAGIRGTGQGQLDDQLEKEFEGMGLVRGYPPHMQSFMNHKLEPLGRVANLNMSGTFIELSKLLQDGFPLVIHTWLTRSGHVAVVRGFDDSAYNGAGAWILNDPNGEWSPRGYLPDMTGENVFYSYSAMLSLFGSDGDIWYHWIDKIK